MQHLLKYQYQPEKRADSWKYTIREHRRRVKRCFQDSPSLKSYFGSVLQKSYQEVRKQAADETGLPVGHFPVELPFTV